MTEKKDKYASEVDCSTTEIELEFRGDLYWFEIKPLDSSFVYKFRDFAREKNGSINQDRFVKKYIEKSVVDTSIDDFSSFLWSEEENIPPSTFVEALKEKIEAEFETTINSDDKKK